MTSINSNQLQPQVSNNYPPITAVSQTKAAPYAIANQAAYTIQHVNPYSTAANLISTLQNSWASLQNISNFFSTQRTLIPEGQSLWGAAHGFGEQVVQFYDAFQTLSKLDSFEQLGAEGQAYLLNSFQQEALGSAANYLGLNTSNLSLSSLGEGAWNWLTTGSFQAGGVEALSASGITDAGAAANGSLSGIGTALGAAGAAYGVYGLIKNWGENTPINGAIQGAATGAYIGSIVPGVGTVIGGLVGAVAGGVMGCFKKSGNSPDQRMRDKMRDALQEAGFLNKDHQITLADGSFFDMGKDGKNSLPNVDGTKRRMFDIDFKDPRAGEVVGMLNPLSQLIFNGNEKLQLAFVGYLTNAALSNTTDLDGAKANVRAFFAKLNITPDQMAAGVTNLASLGKLDSALLPAFYNGIKSAYV